MEWIREEASECVEDTALETGFITFKASRVPRQDHAISNTQATFQTVLDLISSSAHAELVTPAEAIVEIRGYASAGRIVITGHARRRMRERGVDREDLRHALVTAATCKREEEDKWRVRSSDLDCDALQLVVVIEQGVIVVTLF